MALAASATSSDNPTSRFFPTPIIAKSATMYKDMLSPEKLKAYKADGVKDIYIEALPESGNVAKAYAEGRLTKEQALKQLAETSVSSHLNKDQKKQQNNDFLDAVQNARKNGIKIHFAQIPTLAHQQEELNELNKKSYAIYDDITDLRDRTAIKFSGGKALSKKEADAIFSDDMLESLNTSLPADKRLAAKKRYIQGVREQFGPKVPPQELQRFVSDFDKKFEEHWDNKIDTSNRKNEFRSENDAVLSDLISQTRTPGSKTIVIHGQTHGGKSNIDLDDQLAKRGLRTSRIDIDYTDEKNPSFIKDPTPHRYSPNKGSDGTFTVDPSVKSSGFKEPDPTAIVTPESPRPGSNQPPGYGR